MTPEVIFSFLKGPWTFSRAVTGYPNQGRIEGTAFFQETQPGTLHYNEEGKLTLDTGPVLDAGQKYTYRLENGQIIVDYSDGRPFHVLDFSSSKEACGEHLCGQDFYKAAYDFEGPDAFTVKWDVKGPQKDYTITTQYTRQPA